MTNTIHFDLENASYSTLSPGSISISSQQPGQEGEGSEAADVETSPGSISISSQQQGQEGDGSEAADVETSKADLVKQILAKPIQLADQVTKAADDVHALSSFKQECIELKSKTEKLAALLRQAARASSDLYERPARRIIDDTEQVLEKALALVAKSRGNGLMKRVFTIIPAAAFKKMNAQLENSIGDVSWLLRVSASSSDRDDEYLGLPPIAANEPILCLIWEQIAKLYTGGLEESAARAIGLFGRDPERVEHMVHAGVCSIFGKVLKEGPMKVQVAVAWAVSELAANHPKCQDPFAQNNIIRLLVGHLAFETVQEVHRKYAITSNKNLSIHSVVMASNQHPNSNTTNGNTTANKPNEEDKQGQIPHPMGNQTPNQMHNVVASTMANNILPKSNSKPPQPQQQQVQNNGNVKQIHQHSQNHQQSMSSLYGNSIKGRESEDPTTKTEMKAMSARALWHLAAGNSQICKSITESRALLCFAVLLEKGTDDVQYNSAMALMEITAVAEQDADLRRSAFKPNSHAAKAVVDQLLKIIEKADSDLLIPCIKSIGHLARTFKATETRLIGPLVRLLDEREGEVSREAAIALTQFACSENYLHLDHSKAIISAGGAKHLIQLVYFGEQIVQISALVLLAYIALHVPDNEALAHAEVLTVLEWASKQAFMIQDPSLEALLPEAKGRLELYQSRGSRGFH